MLVTISFDPDVFQIEVSPVQSSAIYYFSPRVTAFWPCHRLQTVPNLSCCCQVKPEDSVASLKETLEGVSGIPNQQQMLIYNGKELTSRYVRCTLLVAFPHCLKRQSRLRHLQSA